jgi:type VI secretion system secreted protein Hcp
MARPDYFLKINGLDGESQVEAHKSEIHIDSFHLGVANHGAGHQGTGSGSGKAMVHDLHMTKQTDKASPNLFIACCNGKHFKDATLTVKRAGEHPHAYLVYKMDNVLISSYNSKSHPGGDIATETLSLNFSKVEMSYIPQNKDGSPGAKIVKTFDVASNKAT